MTQKTNRLHFSTRTIAMVLSVIMLIGSIATGSMLSTFAAYLKDSANSDAVSQAASEGRDIALNAIPSEDAAVDNAEEKPDLSGFEENEIVRGMKQDLAGTGAKIDLTSTGATYYLVVSNNDSKPSSMTYYVSASSQSFTVTPATLGLTSFSTDSNYYVGISSSSSYKNMWSQGGSSKVGTTSGDISAGPQNYGLTEDGVYSNYNFAYFRPTSSGVTSVTVTTSFSGTETTYNFAASTTPVSADTWTAVGSSTELFGTAWAPTATANDMTKSGSTWTWTKENVSLTAGTIYYKVAKNHAWTTTHPAENASATVPSTGVYDVTVTYNESDDNVVMTLIPATLSDLMLSSINNAVVKATYNGKTINEGGTLSDVPEGAEVTIAVTPDTGFKCDSVTGTYTSGTVNGTMNGNARSWTIVMPAHDTTVSATMDTVTMKKIFFNNNYTMYAMVSAYARNAANEKPLGTYPGTLMTKIDNSNIWYIEVPDDTDYITFVGDDGYNTGEMSIPWKNDDTGYDYPKYTAPYGANATPDIDHGGTWGNYVWGGSSDLSRGNVYTVTDGTTMKNANLFTGISATLYDYYVDGEAANGNWLTGIRSNEYNMGTDWLFDPYTTFNRNLSAYADATNAPKYDVTNPLYFGVLDKDSLGTNYHHFTVKVNNAAGLETGHKNNALTGLTGKTLADSAIHYYSASDTANENGAPMAMFNEDFLSGENVDGKTLATILRTSSFPVRKETITGHTKIYIDYTTMSSWALSGANLYAHFWDSSDNGVDVLGVAVSDKTNVLSFDIPGSDYTNVKFYRSDSAGTNWWNQSDNLSYSGDNVLFTTTNSTDEITGSFGSCDYAEVANHVYYEYDSTDGKDNAFITNIDTEHKTANIDYYADSEKYVQSSNKKKGFFPFDYNNVIAATQYPTDTLYVDRTGYYPNGNNEYWYARFWVDGSNPLDEAWVKMSGTGDTLTVTNPDPSKYNRAIFVRKSKDETGWSDVINQTADLSLPNGTNKNVLFKFNSWFGGTWNEKSDLQPNPKTDDYADPTDHYAHDQGFGMKLEIPFTLNEDGLNGDGTPQTFDFSGDDDLWVFVDNNLILDLGGAHEATTGSINFHSLTATANNSQKVLSASRNGDFSRVFDNSNPNTVHTMTIYYMERGMFDSNLKFGFSFHAIPNQFKTEKKIRTKDVNSGFYIRNATTTANTKLSGRDVTWFEKTYQNEQFTVTQSYTDNEKPASDVAYTKESNTATAARTSTDGTLEPSSKTLTYNIANDDIYYFLDQFKSGDRFTISESPSASNKYKYIQSVEVFDDANNSKLVDGEGDADNGYSFDFEPTSGAQGGLESLNLRARFTNRMVTHDLTLNKILTNTDDYTTPFTFNIKFDFGDGRGYIAYPIYATVDGVDVNVSDAGDLTVRSGSTVILKGIPEGARIQVTETLNSSSAEYRYNKAEVEYETLSGTPSTTDVNTTSGTNVTKGVQFVMGADNMTATITNSKTGELEITHNLDPVSTGSGTTYVGVEVKDANGATAATYQSVPNGPITLGKDVIDPQKGDYSVTVTLTTEMDPFCKFNKFWLNYKESDPRDLGAGQGPDGAEVTKSYSNLKKTYTLTYKFLIRTLFTEGGQSVPQRYYKMPFYSRIDKPQFQYELTYTYPAYNKSFGNQSYTVKDFFTDDELLEYMNYTNEELSFNTTLDESKKRTFINNHAPYEDNFQKTMDYANSTIDERGWSGSTSTFRLGVTLSQDNKRVYVKFKLPYAYDNSTSFVPTPNASDNKVYHKTATEDLGQVSTYSRDWYSTSGIRDASEENIKNATFVKAPLILADANGKDAYYFQYWSVKTDSNYNNQAAVEYTRCYDPEFNLAIFQDVIVEPIYSSSFPGKMPAPPSRWDEYDRFDPDVMRSIDSENGITITFLENSRNQYNLGAFGTASTAAEAMADARKGGGDRIYSDFLISYNNIAGNVTLKELAPNTKKAGLIIEAVGMMEKNGDEYITSAEYYRNKYGTEISKTTMNKLTNLINGTSQSGFAKSEFDVTSLDNKNRIQYYYSLANKAHTTSTTKYELDDTLTNKYKYFRAYAYIYDVSDQANTIKISPTPVYFTIYDMATIENGTFIH